MNKIIRLDQVEIKSGLSESSIYRRVKDGIFPKPISLGGRSVGWIEDEVDNWIFEKINLRDTT